MGTLADIYSYLDSKKRGLADAIQNPRAALEQMVAKLGEDHDVNLNNQATGYGIGGDRSVLTTPEQQSAARRALADYGAQSGMAGAIVWHGSPYKFDKFDASKIGTGEGAQAYGHGLYLAESSDVAKGYQAANMGRARAKDGFLDSLPPGAQVDAYKLLQSKVRGPMGDARLEALRTTLKPDQFEKLEAAYRGGDSSLYKVDLPDEHIAKMLDWDKPLSQQHPDVQAAVNRIKGGLPLSTEGWNPKPWIEADPLASTFHNTMHREGLLTQDAMSSALQKQGIPGIRYLDGGSRTGGAGTSNFVVFPGNESMLQILERNGAPIPGPLSQTLKGQ